ncbi:MAG: YhgE/Pip domain-containing protein [Lachnospiraceae bacterium]|nr:YhgE/Pip domain-containing protein [Lachnospiraceae bacterium]
MTMIKKIFYNDVKNLFKSLFALIIAVGVCFLPALYAWCNIYSNWDPYGNTGNLKMAAVSLDKGYLTDEGEMENVGDEIIENLHENDKIDWQFVETEEEAKEGVESGKYYGAVVIAEDFSYSMYNVFLEGVEKPQLIFYQNQKKNPVATKISDTVVETLQNNINEKFVKVMTTTVFEDTNDIMEDVDEDGGIDKLIDRLKDIHRDLNAYEDIIDVAVAGNSTLDAAITSASGDVNEMASDASNGAKSFASTEATMKKTQDVLRDYSDQVDDTMDIVDKSLKDIQKTLDKGIFSGSTDEATAAVTNLVNDTNTLVLTLQALNASMNEQAAAQIGVESVTKASDDVNSLLQTALMMQTTVVSLQTDYEASKINRSVKSAEDTASEYIGEIRSYTDNMSSLFTRSLVPEISAALDSLNSIVDSAETLMHNMSETLYGMDDVFSSLHESVNAGNQSLSDTKEAIRLLSEKLEEVIEEVDKVADDEKMEKLFDMLSGDPELYGEFFSEPVQIETNAIYPVENYGSAVTPFYTVLAIWVGALILTAIIKVHPNRAKFPEAREYELFFGRYAIFFVMGQLQTLITVLGDFYLLHVQCIHPFMFWAASAATSLVFSLLIYALVLAFGDVGKALAVVIVVLQIAGSSGTYPIELLPEFFQKVYIFFPFPYAINALRECVAGVYENDYLIYLLQLSLFIVVALAIGIWIRKPFAPVNHYMEKRMEDTEMM